MTSLDIHYRTVPTLKNKTSAHTYSGASSEKMPKLDFFDSLAI